MKEIIRMERWMDLVCFLIEMARSGTRESLKEEELVARGRYGIRRRLVRSWFSGFPMRVSLVMIRRTGLDLRFTPMGTSIWVSLRMI